MDAQGESRRESLNAIFDIVDGCQAPVHFLCSKVPYILAQLAIQLNVCYTRNVQAPGHGKKEVDGLIGAEKTYADIIFTHPRQYAEEDYNDTKAPMHRMDSNGLKTSLAKMLFDVLSKAKRKFKLHENDRKVMERRHHLREVSEAKSHNMKMTANGFE